MGGQQAGSGLGNLPSRVCELNFCDRLNPKVDDAYRHLAQVATLWLVYRGVIAPVNNIYPEHTPIPGLAQGQTGKNEVRLLYQTTAILLKPSWFGCNSSIISSG
jgi:hypothetical protein